LTEEGWSEASGVSADFSVEAEPPDEPAYIEFRKSETSPFSDATVTIVAGATNGAPVEE
jgi:hypothetical protein